MSPGYQGYEGSDRPLLRPEQPWDVGYYEVSGDTGGVILHEFKFNKSTSGCTGQLGVQSLQRTVVLE